MEAWSHQIQEKYFTTALRGYDRGEVDIFMTECATRTGALEERLRIAEVRAEKSEEELAALRASIDVLLQEATEARRKIIEEAKAEAMTVARHSASMDGSPKLADAAAKATAIISEAETAASLRLDGVEQLRRAAENDAAAIVRRGEEAAAMTQAEADRMLDKARMDANSMREETEFIRASMEAQLAEIRRILEDARAGSVDLDDLTSAAAIARSDSDLVIDLRDEAVTTETHHAAG